MCLRITWRACEIRFLGRPTETLLPWFWDGAHDFAFLTSSQVRQMEGADQMAARWGALCYRPKQTLQVRPVVE